MKAGISQIQAVQMFMAMTKFIHSSLHQISLLMAGDTKSLCYTAKSTAAHCIMQSDKIFGGDCKIGSIIFISR